MNDKECICIKNPPVILYGRNSKCGQCGKWVINARKANEDIEGVKYKEDDKYNYYFSDRPTLEHKMQNEKWPYEECEKNK